MLYTNVEATRLRQEAVEKLVAPIFRINEEIGQSKLLQFEQFSGSLSRLAAQGEPTGTLFLKLQLSFPGVLEQQDLARLRPQAAPLLETARRLLEQAAESGSYVDIEAAFRPLPEHELRVADVAYLSAQRFQQADPEDNIRGAPDLVSEVLSPSNTVAEINETEKLCLENGAREFWVVDPDLRQVKVSNPDGITTTYSSGQEIPLRVLGAGALKVDDIFA